MRYGFLCGFPILILNLSFFVFAETVEITSQNIKSVLESRNQKVTASKLGIEASLERKGSFARSFLPSVDVYGGYETFKVGSAAEKSQPVYGAEVKVNVYNGGRDKIEDNIRSLETDRRKFQSRRLMSEELDKARSIYWDVRYLQEKASLLKAALDVNKLNLAAAQRRIKSGVTTDSDRFEFEMKDVELRRELAELEIELAGQIRSLAIVLGFQKETMLTFTEKFAHDHDYEPMLKSSLKEFAFLYKDTELQAEQYSLGARSHRRAWWPKLDAFAAYNQFSEREKESPRKADRTESVIGLRLSMSLPAGLESHRESSYLSKESFASRSLAGYRRQEIEAEVEKEMAQLKFLHGQVHEAEENITRAERYYKLTQSEYGRGVKNSPDVLGASEKLFDMRHRRLEIIRNFQSSKAHLLSKFGM